MRAGFYSLIDRVHTGGARKHREKCVLRYGYPVHKSRVDGRHKKLFWLSLSLTQKESGAWRGVVLSYFCVPGTRYRVPLHTIYYIHTVLRSLVVSTGNREACVLACSQCSHMNKDVNVVIFVWLQFGSTANLLQQKEVNSSSSYVIKNSFEKGEGEEEEERQALLTLFVGAKRSAKCMLHSAQALLT